MYRLKLKQEKQKELEDAENAELDPEYDVLGGHSIEDIGEKKIERQDRGLNDGISGSLATHLVDIKSFKNGNARMERQLLDYLMRPPQPPPAPEVSLTDRLAKDIVDAIPQDETRYA